MTKQEALVLSAYLDTLLTDAESYQSFCKELLEMDITLQETDDAAKEELKDKCEAAFFKIVNNQSDCEIADAVKFTKDAENEFKNINENT